MPQSNPDAARIPEMVGATSEPFYIGKGVTQVQIAIQEPTGPALVKEGEARDPLSRKVFLNIENITCSQWSPPVDVYLNLPSGDNPEQHPELRAGSLPMFGLVEATRGSARHPGDGLYEQLNITALFARLVLWGWDARNLRVAFVPGNPESPPVEIGRVSLYFT